MRWISQRLSSSLISSVRTRSRLATYTELSHARHPTAPAQGSSKHLLMQQNRAVVWVVIRCRKDLSFKVQGLGGLPVFYGTCYQIEFVKFSYFHCCRPP